VEVTADELGNLLPGAHIIIDIHYELGNKLIKRFGHEKQVVFYTFVTKLVGERKRLLKNCQIIPVSSLLSFQQNKKLVTIDINIFILEWSLCLAFSN
jgi:hypothetical protein